MIVDDAVFCHTPSMHFHVMNVMEMYVVSCNNFMQ